MITADYATYLASPQWRAKKDLVLWRDRWLCQACLARRAEDIHHTTYDHVGDEPLYELVALCRECHARLHHHSPQPEPEPAPGETQMPRLNSMYPSKYLKAVDATPHDLTLTIRAVDQERVNRSDPEPKWVLHFRETDRGLVLNKTNASAISKLYGDDTDDWVGRLVTLYATTVEFAGEEVAALRVRSKPIPTGRAKADDEIPF